MEVYNNANRIGIRGLYVCDFTFSIVLESYIDNTINSNCCHDLRHLNYHLVEKLPHPKDCRPLFRVASTDFDAIWFVCCRILSHFL